VSSPRGGKRRGRQPAGADAHYNRGITLAEEWELDEAIAEFRAAIRLQPEHVGAHIGLANALNYEDEAENAIAEFREAIRLQPDNVDAHHGLGDTLGRQGQREEAIAEYRIVIRLQPGSLDGMRTGTPEWDEAAAAASAHFRLAVAHTGRPAGAAIIITECREAIRLQPDFAPAHFSLGKALQAQGEVQQAIAEFREAIRLRPDNFTFRQSLGAALLGQGMVDHPGSLS
jgi:tetratricopeptide (TPR) repeat protein